MPADPNVPKQRAFPSLKWSEIRLLLLVQNALFVKGNMSGKTGKGISSLYPGKLLKFRQLECNFPSQPGHMREGASEGILVSNIIGIVAVKL
ncbi:MAG: hypothetical protein JRJ47_13120 [Deltaproteobacteria bacterium]|nr:hypothetical protein [Deltaproteobacteria bacterium]